MRQSLAKSSPSSPLNSIETRVAKAAIGLNRAAVTDAIALTDDVVSLFFECLAAIQMPDKEAAITMGMDPATLSRIRTKQARLTLEAIWRLPDAFWFEFRERVNEQRGLTVTSARRVRLARIRELASLLVDEAAES